MKNGKQNDSGKKVRKLATQELMEGPCSECGGPVRRKIISQEFEREGVKLKISGFKAWVCSRCGEIYFEPGAADKLVQAANSLFTLAIAGKQHKGKVVAVLS